MNTKNKKQDALPIVFIHKGDSFYLKHALENAKKFNSKSRIILIGDNVTVYPNFVEYYPMENFNEYGRFLDKNYVHLNISNPEIEMFCIKRWLVLLDFMKKNKLNKIFTCDSDILLFQNISKDSKNYVKNDIVIVNGTNGCLTLLNNLEVLEYYKKIVFDFYEKKAKIFKKDFRITDMSFWKQLNDSKKFKVGEATKIINGAFYDSGFLSENHYKKDNLCGIKKLVFVKGLPFGEINKKLFRLKAIHFQGPTKFYMKYFSQGKNNFFIGFKVNLLIWFRDNFSPKISNSVRNKLKKLMIKFGL
jgi:hypothetical protein